MTPERRAAARVADSAAAAGLAFPHPDAPAWIDEHLAAREHSWRQLERGELYDGAGVDELLWWLINSHPVRFAECNFIERPENGGGPWRLFDFQRRTLAETWDADVVNKSGAGVGKTREIVILLAWGLCNRAGGMLFVGNQDGTIEELWEELAYQRHVNAWLRGQLPDDGIRLKPYRRVRASNGNTARFRPTGHDGEPLRAVHVHQFILCDEVAKWHEPRIFKELYRAAEIGCRIRFYSVPDGRRDTQFALVAERAAPYNDPVAAVRGRFQVLAPHRGGAEGGGGSGPEPVDPAAVRRWTLVHWSKPMMPPPYWDAHRRAEWADRYGGEDSNGYRQNVLGLDGDPELAVFPWERLARCLRPLPEYRFLRLVYDGAQGKITAEHFRGNPLAGASETGATSAGLLRERTEDLPLAADLGAYLADTLPPLAGPHVGGGDYGASAEEPTELLVFAVHGPVLRLALRVQLKAFSYDRIRAAWRGLEREVARPSHGWGGDSTGVGTAVEHEILAELGRADRYSGYVWNRLTEARSPESGEQIIDEAPDGTLTPRKVTAKELATELLEHRVARGQLELPYDPDLLREWPSHRAAVTAAGRRAFDRHHDHTIDAARAAALRLFEAELGLGPPAPAVHQVPGSRRASYSPFDADPGGGFGPGPGGGFDIGGASLPPPPGGPW